MENADFIGGSYISIPATVCKSAAGTEDADGNYTFEVEASNENLDLQNQKILQSALLKSKEYFLTNGVVSDDHQHKIRKADGSVETNKDKIIGEPISVRTDGKRTFVKGLLYGAVEAAKPFINLLKAHSSRVKASVGGIMPQVRKNADGSETVTGFMWNDLALTCSPVNWTVGSACFAKSMSAADFCKALSAGNGSDSADFEGGRALQKEEIEKQTKKILDFADGTEESGADTEEIKKSDDDILREALICIDTGELKTRKNIEEFLVSNGFDEKKARDKTLEIIRNGGMEMKKSHFKDTIDELLKSLDSGKDGKKKEKDDDADNEKQENLFSDDNGADESDGDDDDSEDSDDDVSKGGEDGIIDGSSVLKSIKDDYETLRNENAELRKSLDEVKESLVSVTKSFSDYLKAPAEERRSVVEKSISASATPQQRKRPTSADLEVLKSALVKESRAGKIGPEQVQFYSSEFQKSMRGQKISQNVWSDICRIVKDNR